MIKVESNTLERLDPYDCNVVLKTAVENFQPLTKVYDNFYTTIFDNENNRKIGLYFNYGNLKKVTYEKLDLRKD